MPIYSLNGSNISKAYSKEGSTAWSGYTLIGNQCHGDGYPLSKVASYFRSETLSTSDTIIQQSKDWVHLLHITDPHGSGNQQHSQDIALFCLNNTPAEMIILGGDYSVSQWSEEEFIQYITPFTSSTSIDRVYAIMGNHETYPKGTGVETLAKQDIYKNFLQNKSGLTGNPQQNYYYINDTSRKIRYMFLNTSDYYNSNVDYGECYMSSTQLNWIRSNVVLPDSSWHLVVFGHVNLHAMHINGKKDLYMNEENGSAVINAIKQCNGHIIGYICGHQHIDRTGKWNGFQETTLYVDKLENYNYYSGDSVTNRQSGTTQEQAVSFISINTKTKQVIIRRIGAGRNRTISYTYT